MSSCKQKWTLAVGALIIVIGLFSASRMSGADLEIEQITQYSRNAPSDLSPLFFGKSASTPLLEKGENSWVGEIQLGLGTKVPFQVNLDESDLEASKLILDRNCDGEFTEQVITSSSVRENNKTKNQTISFKTSINTEYADLGAGREIGITLYVNLSADGKMDSQARFVGDLFVATQVALQGIHHDIILTDMNHDGLFTEQDQWLVKRSSDKGTAVRRFGRALSDFFWVGEKAYKISLADAYPSKLSVTEFDPGMTKTQDAINRDPQYADRKAKRAEAPLEFSHDIETAIERAKTNGQRYFLDFETDWCGPCKQMDKWVYSAADVVKAAESIVCIKVDGDLNEELAAQNKVNGYPTGILFSAEGKELKRFVGYQSVEEMKRFFDTDENGN
ncbi:thioredoxin family protein [Porticoccaceae bacterium LTM1]|nr:thioredoxin family protein [Porticoccaceae bacterium LTM1]